MYEFAEVVVTDTPVVSRFSVANGMYCILHAQLCSIAVRSD